MKAQILKIAGVKSEAEFYNKYPTEEAFFDAHPEAQMMMKSGGNTPTNPALWSRAKAAARAKYDVYPSAYANGWAAKWYKSKGGGWRKAEYGGDMADGGVPNNPGFNALPDAVQQKIMENMANGGGTDNPGFNALPPYVQAKILGNMADGGQMPEAIARARFAAAGNLDQMADYGYAYGGYVPEMEQMAEGGIPERYKNMGFSKVGTKKNSTRPGKKWMVLAKKGDDYKVVHGGYDGMKDFSQHGSEDRKDKFWSRMGGKNSAKAKDPFSPLYWHKRFGTWAEGGETPEMEMMLKKGGSTHSGNAWYQLGGEQDDSSWIRKILDYESRKGSATGGKLSNWGYNSRNPKTLDEAIGYFKQDYLPKVKDLPMGMRERAADFLYNTGEDARLYQLDQYVRQYENMPNGLPDRGQYRSSGAKSGEFGNLYGQYQAKIDALPMEERIKLMDTGRDYYYRNINTVNGQPSAAYNATWKPRLGIFGNYQAPKPAATAPVMQTQPVVQQPVQSAQAPVATVQQVPRTQFQVQTAPGQTIKPLPVNGFTLPQIKALPGSNVAAPKAATVQTAPVNSYFPNVAEQDYTLDDLNRDAQTSLINPNQGVAAADAMIQNQFQQEAANTFAKPIGNMPKQQPDMSNFNKGLVKAQDKMMSDWANPYSLEGMTMLANNIVEGVNNRKNLQADLQKRRFNYSTDGMYNDSQPSAMNRGQYDMYGNMAPANQSGMMSFAGMNQKYSFADGGDSPYETSGLSWIPKDLGPVGQPFINMAPPVNAAPMRPSKSAEATDAINVRFNLDGNFQDYAQKAQSFLNKKAPGTDISGVDLAAAAQAAYQKTGKLVPVELALAQLQIEGYLAKSNKANKPQRTKNPFNVGNTDDGSVINHNSTASGIKAYYDLMTTQYLKNKTPEQLLVNFTNSKGNRYATNKSYEKSLRAAIGNMKFQDGGEMELTEQEINYIRAMGGEVEFL